MWAGGSSLGLLVHPKVSGLALLLWWEEDSETDWGGFLMVLSSLGPETHVSEVVRLDSPHPLPFCPSITH